ncbi:MAG: hypothetical protein PQJ59_05600 [Spirochaetales bacterium]|nr:hypothetical protein [Spirochaetales bacterium]
MLTLKRAALLAGLPFLFLACDWLDSDSDDTSSTDDTETSWEETLASDPSYPDNVYLTEFVEWTPGQVGSSRQDSAYCDDEGYPLDFNTEYALGPPEGGSSYATNGYTCPVGINGEGTWRFDKDYVIVDGDGDDFTTFTSTFAWSSAADGLACELARVYVSEDNATWYELDPDYISYDENSDPGTANGNYVYANVSGLHGNSPTWANYLEDNQAEELVLSSDGTYYWEDVEGVTVSMYFTPTDDYLGGISFDLSQFISCDDGSAWPSDGRMSYLKIVDDYTILDGQDAFPTWSLGANLMAAMGINTELAE